MKCMENCMNLWEICEITVFIIAPLQSEAEADRFFVSENRR